MSSLGNLFGLPYVVMRKPAPIDTTTLNYNWQIWETNAFSIYTKETDEVGEQSAQEAVAAVLRYLSRVGLLRYHCHSGYLSTVVQENEMANVLTPAGGIFRRFVEPGQEVEYGQKMGVILDPFTAEVEAEITCPTSGVVFFALKKPLTTEHEVAFKVIRRLHGDVCKQDPGISWRASIKIRYKTQLRKVQSVMSSCTAISKPLPKVFPKRRSCCIMIPDGPARQGFVKTMTEAGLL